MPPIVDDLGDGQIEVRADDPVVCPVVVQNELAVMRAQKLQRLDEPPALVLLFLVIRSRLAIPNKLPQEMEY